MSKHGFILILIAATMATAIALTVIFSQVMFSESAWMQALYLLSILALIGGRFILYKRMTFGFALKAAVIWLSIGFIIVLVYRFYDEL